MHAQTGSMDPKFDIAKVVGVASAPVALVIAACIYLGNLNVKYNALFARVRNLTEELRAHPDNGERTESLHDQLHLYERRLRGTMLASFWLNIAVICFIATVLFTGITALFPGNIPLIIITATVMFGGLVILTMSVIMELWYNRLAKNTLQKELTSGTPQYEAVTMKAS